MQRSYLSLLLIAFTILSTSCQNGSNDVVIDDDVVNDDVTVVADYKLPNIDLNNWKVTLPIGNPTEVKPPAILDYANNATSVSYTHLTLPTTPYV